MYKKIVLVFLLIANSAIAQYNFRVNKKEYFTVSTSIDPVRSFKEKGADIVAEIEYVGIIYVKMGIERFSALEEGYRDIHWAIGMNFTNGVFEQTRFYSGIRTAKVNRGNYGAYRINYGVEAGVDYSVSNNFFIGLRSTIDKRIDEEIFRKKKNIEPNVFLRLGYRWDFVQYRR